MTLVDQVLAGERLALSRLLTLVENETNEGWSALDRLFAHTGRAHVVGVTGAPGTGKSSLVNKLALAFRHPENGYKPVKVAIIAVDPSSPFSGGALLGDRLRMRDVAGDTDVFIRSMATRGALGGLAHTTAELSQVFDAAGFDIVLVETVGAGQSEIDIARMAHTVIVVEAPGLGDDIQTIKAGILEIADILVVNKADRPGAESTERALKAMLEMAQPDYSASRRRHRSELSDLQEGSSSEPSSGTWNVPVIKTVATLGAGVPELAQLIRTRFEHIHHSGEWAQRENLRLRTELEEMIQEELAARWKASLPEGMYASILEDVHHRRKSPHEAVHTLVNYDCEPVELHQDNH